jgi:hypothetical protein
MAQIPTEARLANIGCYSNRVRCIMSRFKWSRPVRSFLQTLAYSSKVLMLNLRDLHVVHVYSICTSLCLPSNIRRPWNFGTEFWYT